MRGGRSDGDDPPGVARIGFRDDVTGSFLEYVEAAFVGTRAPMMLRGGHRSSCRYDRSVLPTLASYVTGMWKARLQRPIRLDDGRIVRTLAEARDVILELPKKVQLLPQWQSLAGLLLSAAHSRNGDLLPLANARLEEMLPRIADAAESVLPRKKPPAPSVKRRLSGLKLRK